MSIISNQDIGTHFGGDKCICLRTEKSTTVTLEQIEINQLKIKPVDEGDCYIFIGIYKNISYSGMLNKEKVTR